MCCAFLFQFYWHGEAASSDKAEKFVIEFSDLIKEGDYLPQQVFNGDETGLFWKQNAKMLYY